MLCIKAQRATTTTWGHLKYRSSSLQASDKTATESGEGWGCRACPVRIKFKMPALRSPPCGISDRAKRLASPLCRKPIGPHACNGCARASWSTAFLAMRFGSMADITPPPDAPSLQLLPLCRNARPISSAACSIPKM